VTPRCLWDFEFSSMVPLKNKGGRIIILMKYILKLVEELNRIIILMKYILKLVEELTF
jgi:hypothetical protein